MLVAALAAGIALALGMGLGVRPFASGGTVGRSLLVVGADEGGRADVVLLVFLADPPSVLILPRDSMVDPGQKLNGYLRNGGMPALVSAVKRLTGVKPARTMLVEMDRVPMLVDRIWPEGVKLHIPYRMKYRDLAATPPLVYDIPAGLQRLNGLQVLCVLRDRSDHQGDLGRTQRQMAICKELLKQVLRSPQRMLTAANASRSRFETDLGLADMLSLLRRVRSSAGRLAHMRLPGEPVVINGISYFDPDLPASRRLCDRLARGLCAPDGTVFFVLNASKTPALAQRVASRMSAALGVPCRGVALAARRRTTTLISYAPETMHPVADAARRELGVGSTTCAAPDAGQTSLVIEVGDDYLSKEAQQ